MSKCTKLGYPNLRAARTALNACKKTARYAQRRRERSFYLCPHCKQFHLTSEKPEDHKRFT